MPNPITKAANAVRDKIAGSDVLVRFRQCTSYFPPDKGWGLTYQAGQAYKLSAAEAREHIKGGSAVELTDDFSRRFAEEEIRIREMID